MISCKQCRHHLFDPHLMMYAECARKVVWKTDPKTGEEIKVKARLCSTERRATHYLCCGPSARYFEPRPKLWERIKSIFTRYWKALLNGG